MWNLTAMSLLFTIAVHVDGVECLALLDSGASENFISHVLANSLQLPRHKLRNPFTVKAANGELIRVKTFARLSVYVDTFVLRFSLRTGHMHPQIVLGMPFLRAYNPHIN